MQEMAAGFRAWMAEHADELAPYSRHAPGSIEAGTEHEKRFQQLLFDGGWSRYGWPEEVGGLGGTSLLRAVFHEELSRAGYVMPETMLALEVIAPTVVKYRPDLAAAHLPAHLKGDEVWCQGFSEPDAGSDLAALRTRAVEDGDCFRVNGQKIWSSFGHLSRWCVLLVRTGTPESRHRGITFLWCDLQSPGIEVRPIMCASDRNELAEVFFDDVMVPKANLVGDVDRGWDPLMFLMQFERGGYAWGRQAWLHGRLSDALADAGPDVSPTAKAAVGEAWLLLSALRERCWHTVVRLSKGEHTGPESSVDKLLMSSAEQAVYDAADLLRGDALELGDDDASTAFRQQWYFSRMVTVMGGASDVQRDIVAERIMQLPRNR